MDKKELIRNESNVLVLNGVAYSMVRFKEPMNIVVCTRCDLQKLCFADHDSMPLVDLCKIGDGENGWFFQQDWEILNKSIRDYTDVCDVDAEDFL